MKDKGRLVDIGLVIIILAMGAFVYFQLTRIFTKVRGQVQETDKPQQATAAEIPTLTQETIDVQEAMPAPAFTLTSLEGNPVSLSDHKGTAVMINFWATWCPPCLAELPMIEAFSDTYSYELVVLAVNAGEAREDVLNFVNEHGYDLKFLLDPSNSLGSEFRVRGLPTSVFIDQEGFVQAMHIGLLDENLLIDYLSQVGVVE